MEVKVCKRPNRSKAVLPEATAFRGSHLLKAGVVLWHGAQASSCARIKGTRLAVRRGPQRHCTEGSRRIGQAARAGPRHRPAGPKSQPSCLSLVLLRQTRQWMRPSPTVTLMTAQRHESRRLQQTSFGSHHLGWGAVAGLAMHLGSDRV